MTLPFCTVGHSTRTIEAFVELLKTADVELVVDIRSVPKSRTNPQYNKESLPELLAPFHIAYEQVAELGGLRRKSKEVSAEVNGFWENRSFHNYADYALTDSFHSGLDQLIELGRERRCAVMCAEAVWCCTRPATPRIKRFRARNSGTSLHRCQPTRPLLSIWLKSRWLPLPLTDFDACQAFGESFCYLPSSSPTGRRFTT